MSIMQFVALGVQMQQMVWQSMDILFYVLGKFYPQV